MGTKVSGFGVELDFSKHVSQRAPHAHRTAKFFHIKGAFIDVSTGAPDAGKPIKLDSSGKIDSSMYDAGANHNLLSAVHPDTVVGSPVRGDLIVGNATPKWEKIALGTTGKFLRSDGSDALWVLLVAGDLPSHSHAWGDVSKVGSNLTDLVTRTHAGLQTVTENQHHNKVHAIVGTAHTASGLTVGYVIRASGATSFVWAQLQHGDLGGVTIDQHHARDHDLLQATHPDTLAGTVVRGDLMVGNSTPKWARFGLGAIGKILSSDGTDIVWIDPPAGGGVAVPHPFLFIGY